MNYILNDIKESPEADFLDEDMYKELRGYVISLVSLGKQKTKRVPKTKKRRSFWCDHSHGSGGYWQ